MKSRVSIGLVVALFIVCAGCAKKEHRAAAAVENMAQALRNEAADSFSKPPEAHSDRIETGTSRFEVQMTEGQQSSSDGVTTRPFVLIIRNRSSEPQKFQSSIRYLERDGDVVRTKSLADTVVAPYEEKKITGMLAVPDRVAPKIVSAQPEVVSVKWDRGEEAGASDSTSQNP